MKDTNRDAAWGWARLCSLACLALLVAWCSAASAASAALPAGSMAERAWQVQGVKRQALVYVPALARREKAPIIFAFHGHGGSMSSAAEKFAFHTLWPEAITVYPQGLPRPGKFDPAGLQAGWQKNRGDDSDRDILLFDAILGALKRECKVDEKRIYATGHSNGGGFTYVLWAARGDALAAVAPSASGATRATMLRLKPLPAMHIAGEQDAVVPFANQKRTMERIRILNGCQAQGQPWARTGDIVGTQFPSGAGTPFVSVIHPGGHKMPDAVPALIARFFKAHSR